MTILENGCIILQSVLLGREVAAESVYDGRDEERHE